MFTGFIHLSSDEICQWHHDASQCLEYRDHHCSFWCFSHISNVSQPKIKINIKIEKGFYGLFTWQCWAGSILQTECMCLKARGVWGPSSRSKHSESSEHRRWCGPGKAPPSAASSPYLHTTMSPICCYFRWDLAIFHNAWRRPREHMFSILSTRRRPKW